MKQATTTVTAAVGPRLFRTSMQSGVIYPRNVLPGLTADGKAAHAEAAKTDAGSNSPLCSLTGVPLKSKLFAPKQALSEEDTVAPDGCEVDTLTP